METGAEETEKSSPDWKNIRIKEDTYTCLSALGSMKDSFDDVINRLLDYYDFPPSKSIDDLRKYAHCRKMPSAQKLLLDCSRPS
jgi:hypothetical protein